MHTVTAQHLWNKSFILCLANNLFLFIFYFAQTTILPIYILKDLGGDLSQAGLAMTLFMVSAIAVRPFSGLIIEKLGTKKTLYISETLFCLFSLTYIWADNLTILMLIRFLHGIWFSILTTVTVPIANEFIPTERKGEGMGYFLMSINLGIVLGPLISLTLIQNMPYVVVASILAGFVVIGFIFCFLIPLPSVQKPPIKPTKKALSRNDFIEFKALPVALMAMMVSFCYASIMSFIATFAESKHMLAYASMFFVVFAISMMILRPFTGKIYDRKGPNAVVYPALILFSIGLAVLAFIENVVGFLFAAALIGMGFGSAQPCLQTIAIQRSPKNRIGHATSTYFTFYDIGIAIGSIVLGLLIANTSYTMTYVCCSLLVMVSLIYYKFMVSKKPDLLVD